MLLVQDQYRQSSRKNFESQLQLKQNTSKQLFSDPKEIWEIEFGCEEEIISSGNDSEQEDNILYAEPSDQQEEVIEARKTINQARKKFPKNVRFEGSDFNYVPDSSDASSLDDYLDVDCEYVENETYGHQRSLSQDPEIIGHKVKEPLRVSHKTKLRTIECGYEKKYNCERRPKSSPEKSSIYLENTTRERRPISMGEYNDLTDPRYRTRRKEHRCGRLHHEDLDLDHVCGEPTIRKSAPRNYKLEYGDDGPLRQRHVECCDHCPMDETRLRTDKKTYAKLKPTSTHASLPGHKHTCHLMQGPCETEMSSKTCKKNHRDVRNSSDFHLDSQSFPYHSTERYCQMEDYCDHICSSKAKKKILEAVQEQQEQFSDSTYKIPCPKYSSQTIPLELSGFPGKRSSEKFTNSSQSDWLYCSTKGNESLFGEKVVREVQLPRIHKMRSRRTRMNRLKNGWKKAFVQTVRDGTRNERVGVIVMGPKGPEFYAKNLKPSSECVPFRKSKSFLDGAAKSFEVMTVDCKNVFLSSSEPGPRTNFGINDLVCPEDDAKVEEKIAKFSKNVSEIVKTSEEKFYKGLSINEFNGMKKPDIFKGAGEGEIQDEKKEEQTAGELEKKPYPPFHLLPFESLSPRVPKTLRTPEKRPNKESKAIADALNEQAKQYKENQSNLKDKEQTFLEGLKELQEKYPPKERNLEKAEENLSLWGMKLDDMSEKAGCSDVKKGRETEEEETGNESSIKKETNVAEPESSIKRKSDQENFGKDEMSQSGSIKSNEQITINKQRRKKYYETTTARSRKAGCNIEISCDGDAPLLSKTKTEPETNGKGNKRIEKTTKWSGSVNASFDDQNSDSKISLQNTDRNTISAVFRDLVENGCAISREESENLQNLFNQVTYSAEVCSNDAISLSSSEVIKAIRETKLDVSPRSPKSFNSYEKPKTLEGKKEVENICRGFEKKKEKERRTYYDNERQTGGDAITMDNEDVGKENVGENRDSEGYLGDIKSRKVSKMKNYFDEKLFNTKFSKKLQSKHREGKSKKKILAEDKMKLLRKTLPSIAAQNEAAHLKQLKKYIDRFIDRVEASTSSEFRKRKESRLKSKEHPSTDSSEVKVDARKILDFVSNPFKKISSDVTINIAKKLTDALVQDKSSKNLSPTEKGRKFLGNETDEDSVVPWGATSGSDRCEESEPTYLKQLKKMRNEHLNNIVMEVKRLSELLRFLDRCNRLNV